MGPEALTGGAYEGPACWRSPVGGALLAGPCWRSPVGGALLAEPTGSADAHDDLEANAVDVFGAMFWPSIASSINDICLEVIDVRRRSPHAPRQIMGNNECYEPCTLIGCVCV